MADGEQEPAASAGLSPELAELGEIIKAYSEATAELQQSHELLQQQVRQLSGELQRKNLELSDTVIQVSNLKNYLAGIIQSSADGIVAIDLNRRVMAWNPAANVLLELSDAAPETASGARADAEKATEGKFILDVMTGQCRQFALMMMQSLQDNRRYSGVEIKLTDKSGRTRYFSASASPVRSPRESGEDRTVGAVQIFSELTDIRELEERANRQDRLAALGEMAAGVAHEIRNPLGGIELYASSLGRKFSDGSSERATCDKIIAAAASLNRIVTDMLTFTRGRPPQARKCQAGQIIRTALEMAARELDNRGIEAVVRLEEPDRPVLLDPDQMAQAALNVILNAAQAMGRGGAITVASATESGPAGQAVLALSVADQGPGIPNDAKAKIFDPFFTMRKDGTGLGLAIVHKIIQDHGGAIDVADNPGGGAVITFRVPAVPA